MKNKSYDRRAAGLYGVRLFILVALMTVGPLPAWSNAAEVSVGAAASLAGVAPDEPAVAPSVDDIVTVLRSQFHIGLEESMKIANAVLSAARRDMISPVLLLAVIAVESNFDRHAISTAGASGLMQVMPSQHRDLVRAPQDLADANTNISVGSTILHRYLEAADGDIHIALVRYSGGSKNYPGRVANRANQIENAIAVRARLPAASAPTTFE
jgi:soluble lytic murein transglycosylase-like protein